MSSLMTEQSIKCCKIPACAVVLNCNVRIWWRWI